MRRIHSIVLLLVCFFVAESALAEVIYVYDPLTGNVKIDSLAMNVPMTGFLLLNDTSSFIPSAADFSELPNGGAELADLAEWSAAAGAVSFNVYFLVPTGRAEWTIRPKISRNAQS